MKTKIIFFVILLGLFSAPAVQAIEKIDNFEVSLTINSDSSLMVKERIEYDFGSELKHGIIRSIPIIYEGRIGNYNLRISDISVEDENGNDYKFSISRPNKYIEIKIGDENELVTGRKIYIINYKIRRAINYFSDYDELYWNVTGNDWLVSIEKAKAIVYLGEQLKKEEIRVDCFAGFHFSAEKCELIDYKYEGDFGLVSQVVFNQEKLSPSESLTIVVGFPKGLVREPDSFQKILEAIEDNWILLVPVVVFFVMFFLWLKRGRDPKGRGTIITQFGPPENLTPAEIGIIIDERFDRTDISAEIIYLAIKGYFKIVYIEKKGLFRPKDYEFVKLKEPDDLINDFDKKLMKAIFDSKASVKLSDLKKEFYMEVAEIKKAAYNSVVNKGYFFKNPDSIRFKYALIASVLLGIFYFARHFLGVFVVISFFASIIIIFVFAFLMPVKSKKGVLVKEDILGLKRYLSVAEKERLAFHNAPEKKPEHFEELLPYAMVLGVEKKWAEQFEGIYNQAPNWYAGPMGVRFSATVLVGDLGRFRTSTNVIFGGAPAGRGVSGFGGGGFSGGGFGGGGGRSW